LKNAPCVFNEDSLRASCLYSKQNRDKLSKSGALDALVQIVVNLVRCTRSCPQLIFNIFPGLPNTTPSAHQPPCVYTPPARGKPECNFVHDQASSIHACHSTIPYVCAAILTLSRNLPLTNCKCFVDRPFLAGVHTLPLIVWMLY
jgi:hypothetical protein